MLIAQVSDIHASPDNDHLNRFDRVLTWFTQLNPDVLVLTGDLTDGPWLEGYRQIADRLNQQKYPSLLLPGNADDRGQTRRVWGRQRWAQDTFGEALHFTDTMGDLRLTGIDSTVNNEDVGSVSDHLTWLEEQLRHTDNLPTLLFMHHHVFASGIPTLDRSMCKGTDALSALIKRLPGSILAISTGHLHRPVAATFADIPAYICGSICPANPVWFGTENIPPANDPPALMVHRYIDNALTSHTVSV